MPEDQPERAYEMLRRFLVPMAPLPHARPVEAEGAKAEGAKAEGARGPPPAAAPRAFAILAGVPRFS